MTRRCINHPEREAPWFCSKHSVAYCDECCRCPHPEGYCKFRSQCAIWQMCPKAVEKDARTVSRATANYP